MRDNVEGEKKLGPMLAYSAGNLPVGFLLLAVSTWLMRLYCPSADEEGRTLLVNPDVFGTVSMLVMFIAALADPIIGHWSDRTRSRWGRRQPFIRFGLVFLAFFFLLVWFPPVRGESFTNVIWLFVMLGGLHISFTVVVNPYLALMPEVWRTDDGRVRVSAWMAGFNAIAQIVGFVMFGVLISLMTDGGDFLGIFVWDGWKVSALVCFALTLGGFLPTITSIHETPHGEEKEIPYSLFEAGLHTLKNPAFVPYIGAAAMLFAGQFLIVAVLPFLVVTQIAEDPSMGDMMASLMLLGLVLVSAVLYPVAVKLADRYRKTQLMMASLMSFVVVLPLVTLSGRIPFVSPMVHLIVACALIAPGLAIGMVIPRAILADVMDHDAKLTGFRREAMYNGMEGLLQKIAGGLAPLVQGLLFAHFGYTSERPWGIVLCGAAAGLMALAGVISFKFYPLKK